MFNDWNANYEKITNMIVPRSTQLIHQDNDYGLFTVTLFKKVRSTDKHLRRYMLVSLPSYLVKVFFNLKFC